MGRGTFVFNLPRKKASTGVTGVLAKQRRQKRWKDTIIFLYRNTTIATERYMSFERDYWSDFRATISGRENTLRDLAVLVNRAKIAELPQKKAPMSLAEFKAQQPKKLTKKQKIKEQKTPSIKPLPKPTLETAFVKNEESVPLEQYLDIMNRLFTISNIANDFNKQLVKFPDECLPEQTT